MSRQVSPATERVYGLQRVTRIWGVSRATIYRHRHPAAVTRKRPGPRGAMADEALVAAIRQLLADSPFHGEGYRKLWARLRLAGIRTSRRRVLRLMREHGLLAHQRAGCPRGSRAHDGTITTERVDVRWGTDLTSVVTGEGQAAVLIAVDHCSAECVGIHRARRARSAPAGTARTAGRGPAAAPIASRRSSRCGRRCASISVVSPRAPPPACNSATIMEANMSATTSKPSSASSASRARRHSCASRRGMAAPSGTFAC
jgi:transposase InsO family protein